ncbi:hypothetical protein JCM24511_07440 [Saitozyma sp. JCM 24511]|nr:hypothetical protein JCM24511_07440 [Saitozyma sp. JCM 24511]
MTALEGEHAKRRARDQGRGGERRGEERNGDGFKGGNGRGKGEQGKRVYGRRKEEGGCVGVERDERDEGQGKE